MNAPFALVHLPSGPVAGHWRAPSSVDVAGATLPVIRDPSRLDRLLARLPDGRTVRVEAYVHGALDIQRGSHRVSDTCGEPSDGHSVARQRDVRQVTRGRRAGG